MRVAVVGAGMAGAAATSRLTRAGVEVILLEASCELGGRVRPASLAGAEVDLGPSWLHETLVNPLFAVAVQAGVEVVYDDASALYVLPSGESVLPSDRVEPIKREVEQAIALAYHTGEEAQQPPMRSLRDFVRDFLRTRPLLSERQRLLAARMVQENEHWTAQAWEDIPAAEAVHDALGRNAFVLGGMRRVWELVWELRDARRTTVRVGEEVTSITQGEEGVVVGTSQGEVEVDGVVCTIPLGGLKRAVERQVFRPPLPGPLLESISTTDVAALGKAFLYFDEVWWHAERDTITVLVDEPVGEEEDGPATQRPVTFVNVYVQFAPERGAVLLALTGPPLTQLVERHPTPDGVYGLLLPSLMAIRRDTSAPPPRPREVRVSSWTRDPLFGGSYSARRIGQSYSAMVQPFLDGHGKVVFAGEHTVWDGAGCVHGAYASGLRAADDLLEQAGVDVSQLPACA